MPVLSSLPSAALPLRAGRFSLPACNGFTQLDPQAVPHMHTERKAEGKFCLPLQNILYCRAWTAS